MKPVEESFGGTGFRCRVYALRRTASDLQGGTWNIHHDRDIALAWQWTDRL